MKSLPLIAILLLTLNACKSQTCAALPNRYSSFAQAVTIIKKTSFAFTEVANTNSSSWIRSASYYSCDGKTGYLIFLTDKQEYIHKDVPISVWIEFKNADSFGRYYYQNIMNRYQMTL